MASGCGSGDSAVSLAAGYKKAGGGPVVPFSVYLSGAGGGRWRGSVIPHRGTDSWMRTLRSLRFAILMYCI